MIHLPMVFRRSVERCSLYHSYIVLKVTSFFYVACNCSIVGSKNPDQCDRNSGQCSCKPNVIGRTCDQCRPDYFNFASGQGCQGMLVRDMQYVQI